MPVDRPFWLDKDEITGRDTMSMTLTDRMTRVQLLDGGPDRPAVICLSYTWCDDSLKWLPLSANERMEVMLKSLSEIYRHVDIRKHIIGSPVTVLEERLLLHGRVQGQSAGALPLSAAAVHPPHAGPAARPTSAASSSPATTSPGRRAGPRAPSRPRSTPCGA
ncbi:hypothetical protein SANTM175S_03920 [Streptomyces antimycoticus]